MNLSGIYAAIGPAGTVLIFVACGGLFLALRTLLFLHLVWREFKRDFLDVEQSSARNWNNVVNASDNPLVCVIRDIAQTHGEHSEDIRAEVAYLFHRNFARVTRSLCWIRLVSIVSPLLGLLGTVLGMVTVFRTIAENAAPNPAMLAAGIWEALITTIMGLCIAIPMLMFYYYLMLKFRGFHIEAVEHSYRALELCSRPGAECFPSVEAAHA